MASKTRKAPTSKRPSKPALLTNQVREAVRKELNAQTARERTLDSYANRLEEADKQVTEFIQQVIKETTRAFRTTIGFYIASFSVSALLLIGGLSLALINSLVTAAQQLNLIPIALICILVGIVGMVFLQIRNPVKNLRYIVDNLVKLNVIFAGYIRQIHQVDAVFEELVGSGKDITPQIAEQLLNNLQDAMTEAMSAISIISSELDD